MASQSTNEMGKASLASSEDGHVDPREALETLVSHGDRARNHDPSPQDNPQPPNQGITNVEGNVLLGLSFPRKLWRIVEDDCFTSVHWNDDGDTVIIEKDLFQREVLCRRGNEKIFESDSLKSFIRLLNLHGFSKIRPGYSSVCYPGNNVMIYRNCNFQRDQPWLVQNIKTQENQMTCTWPESSATPLKRTKRLTPTRYSLRLQQKGDTKEAEEKAQRKPPNSWEPSATQFFKHLHLQPTSSAMDIQCPSEAGGPSGEGTSGHDMLVPTATARTDSMGALPPRSPNYPLRGPVKSLYNICYSTLIASLSLMSLPLLPEEEQEVSVHCYCSLCEQFKDNAGP